MSYVIYEKARKLGEKAYREAVSHGRPPYLPVLDEMVSREEIRGEVSLGLVSIPLNRVVGTATAGRTNAFASNFMPVLDMKTEFGVKWTKLCEAQMTEGIRDPIKVYEYLNYYYVVEGNKRVSVLKYFGADTIPAFVTRKVPRYSEDPEIRKYYAFMDFYRKTGVNYIWFSREEGFAEMIDAVGVDENGGETLLTEDSQKVKAPAGEGGVKKEDADQEDGKTEDAKPEPVKPAEIQLSLEERERVWSEDTRLTVKSAYYRFQKIYLEKGGARLGRITTGDAFLSAVKLHSLNRLEEMNSEEMKDMVTGMWEEFRLLNNRDESVEVALDPPEKKKNLFNQIFPAYSVARPLTAAFVYEMDPSVSDWSFGHELGRNHVTDVFGGLVRTLKVVPEDSGRGAIEAMEALIGNEGADVIFTTTASLIDASLKCAVKYPDVRILNCSINTSHRYIRTYAARLFEAKFLSGMVAGALSREGKLGYLADYPIFGVTAEINAFALGARMVRPGATVKLCWTTLKEGSLRSEIEKELLEEGVDFVSGQDMIAPVRSSRRFGLYQLGEAEPVNFATTLYNWGVFYEQILRMVLSGTWNGAESSDELKALNYWWGFSAGVIDIILSEKIPAETRRMISLFRKEIINENLHPFEGPIRDNTGREVSEAGHLLSTDEIMRMDWLAENVTGSIPPLAAFKNNARQIVEMKGVLQEGKERENEDSGDR